MDLQRPTVDGMSTVRVAAFKMTTASYARSPRNEHDGALRI